MYVPTYDHYCVLCSLRFLQSLFNDLLLVVLNNKKSSLVIHWRRSVSVLIINKPKNISYKV